LTVRASAQPRRSQEERSAATRQRLLDATVDCLIELGYVGTTTTEIVRRAGVSRGAQVHHFPTKAELVQQAVVHLAQRRQQELRDEFERVDANADRVSLAIELLWSAYAGPLFAAALELIVAARTDDELKPALSILEADIRTGIEKFCRENFGTQSTRRRAFRDGLELTIDVMHGMALVRLLDGRRSNEARLLETWKTLVRPMLENGSGTHEEKGKKHG
jgi:AcrR family transcriptional regulator